MGTTDTNKELAALINLIDEPDELIYKQIRDKILSYGKDAIPCLEKAWENNLQVIVQKRIEILLHKIQFGNLTEELNNWYSLGGANLIMGYTLVSRLLYPNLDEQKIKNEFKRIQQDIWLELNSQLTAFEKISVFNRIFYIENRFEQEKSDLNSPLIYYLNNVLETRKGNHLSLALVYLILADLVELPVYGVNLPGHFVLAYMDEHTRIPGMPLSEADVLFYINPFNKGAFFTRNEIDLYLKQRKIESQYSYFHPCSNITAIKRLLQELRDVYAKSGNEIKSGEVEILLKIFQ